MDGCRFEDRGQALPLVVVLLWLVMGAALLLAALASAAIDRSRAQAGADAVALAGVVDPSSIDAVAAANEVTVMHTTSRGDTTLSVRVRSGEATAPARAAAPPLAHQGLDPRMIAALAAAEQLLGEPVVVVSGLRSRADQQRLWDQRHTNPYPVAPPGTSRHELGQAVDVALRQVAALSAVAGAVGLCHPLPVVDPVHFVLCEMTPTR